MGTQTVGTSLGRLRAPEGQRLLRQTYEATPLPEGVITVPQRIFPDDAGGSFKEVVRLSEGMVTSPVLREHGIHLTPAQINVSVVAPGTRRFWHVHPNQNELWTISHGQLNAGLVDCREGSPTFGRRSKLVLTPQVGLYIPAGVAHGFANESGALVVLHYLPDKQFSAEGDSEELRIDPSELSFDFVLSDVM